MCYRPDDHHLGVPETGDFTDDVRFLHAPVVADLPHRVANDLFQRCTGVALSSRGAQGIIDSTAQDLSARQTEREMQEAAAAVETLGTGDGASDLRIARLNRTFQAFSASRRLIVQVVR